jgi:uncharacterized protein YbjT (DUF2867 family)
VKVILFGASGMVGQGVLRECLLAPEVEQVLSIGRSATGPKHPKLREVQHADFSDFSALEPQLAGFDACFYCLGATAGGKSEAEYTRITFDFTLAAARPLASLNPGMTFVYVSGASTDATERGRIMWARVKGRTENALLALPFKAAVMFRPAGIIPVHGVVSKTAAYRIFYVVLGPLLPLLRRLFPAAVTTTELIGRAMLNAVRIGAPKQVLESADIDALGARTTAPPASPSGSAG